MKRTRKMVIESEGSRGQNIDRFACLAAGWLLNFEQKILEMCSATATCPNIDFLQYKNCDLQYENIAEEEVRHSELFFGVDVEYGLH
jgi:hypothetical protein